MKTTITASRGRCTFAPLGAVRSAMSWVTSTPSACPATISTTWDTATSVGKAKSVVSGAASIMRCAAWGTMAVRASGRLTRTKVARLAENPLLRSPELPEFVLKEYDPLLDSSNMGPGDWLRIAEDIRVQIDQFDGVLVIHGTDTMDLTAFTAQLLLGTSADRRPVVFTGSMRVHSHPQPDGPANLRDAIAAASSEAAVGRDVLVCMEGVLHAADRVVKHHAASVDAFHSAPLSAVGRVSAGAVEITAASPPRTPATAFADSVPLVTGYPGIDADEVAARLDGAAGAVVEGFGDLNVPQQLWLPIHTAWQRGALVVLASRPFTPTTTNDGLALLGAVGAGGLTAQKARLAVMAALGTEADREAAVAFLHQYALVHDTADRGTSA